MSKHDRQRLVDQPALARIRISASKYVQVRLVEAGAFLGVTFWGNSIPGGNRRDSRSAVSRPVPTRSQPRYRYRRFTVNAP
jgi:hypothetical protein